MAKEAGFKARIVELEQTLKDYEARFVNLEQKLISKKNHKFQNKCIKIATDEEPIIEYRSSFLNRLEFDAFFRYNRIALEVQGAQHRFHSTSWYCGIKVLKNSRILLTVIERKEPCVNLTGFIFLRYGMMRIQKLLFLRRYVNLESLLIEKSFILINLINLYNDLASYAIN